MNSNRRPLLNVAKPAPHKSDIEGLHLQEKHALEEEGSQLECTPVFAS